jgi:hypothetical protein
MLQPSHSTVPSNHKISNQKKKNFNKKNFYIKSKYKSDYYEKKSKLQLHKTCE